jgi:hypothetical protein
VASYEDAIRYHNRKVLYKLVFCDKNEISIENVIASEIEGNLSIELKNGMRRTGTITLVNTDGKFTPSSDGLVSFTNRLKIYTGLRFEGVDYYNERGVFLFGNPRMTRSSDGESIISLEVYDKFALMDGTISGTIDKDYLVPVGTYS